MMLNSGALRPTSQNGDDRVFQGSFLKLTAGRQLTTTLGESEKTMPFAMGETLDLSWDSNKTMVFDRD